MGAEKANENERGRAFDSLLVFIPRKPEGTVAGSAARHKKKRLFWRNYFFTDAMNSSMGIAGIVVICTVPREPNSMETFATVSLF